MSRWFGVYFVMTAAVAAFLVAGSDASAQEASAKPEQFVGAWYCLIGGEVLEVDLVTGSEGLTGTVKTLRNPSEIYTVSSSRIEGDQLHLEVSLGPEIGTPLVINIRPPKDELIAAVTMPGTATPFPCVISRTRPEMPEPPAASPGNATGPGALELCANNLKQLGLMIKMYANESKGEKFPVLDPTPGNLMCRPADLYPEYITDLSVLICPADAEAMAAKPAEFTPEAVAGLFTDRDYWYLGFAIETEEQGMAFIEAYRTRAASGEGFETDMTGKDEKPIYRLREGIERFFITDINDPAQSAMASQMPVIIERPGHHGDEANVLYLDGHVEAVKYPGKFPMTKQFIEALESLDALAKK